MKVEDTRPKIENLLQSYALEKFLKENEVAGIGTEELSGIIDNEMSVREKLFDVLLLLDTEDYNTIATETKTDGEYVLLDCISPGSPLIHYAKKFANKNGLQVLSMSGERKYYKFERQMEVELGQYLGLIKNARMIISDTFISAFLGILYEKDIIVRDSKTSQGKILSLLTRLHMTQHYCRRMKRKRNVIYVIQEKDHVSDMIRTIREKGKDHILELLGSKKEERRVLCPTDILQNECSGCYACEAVCPKNAITMKKDAEGFYYPHVNDQCIHCNLCAHICIKKENAQTVTYKKEYPKVYCAINRNEALRETSSSGALFPALAEYMIHTLKGVVFGVRFNEKLQVETAMAQTIEEVKAFYGSKYVKSEIKDVYQKVKEKLKANCYVLYTGLPCECAGLKAYLGREYERLFICDIICHAAPSPDVFKDYVRYMNHKFESQLTNITFREKSKGWKLSQCRMIFEFKDREPLIVNSRRNNYFRGFLKNIIARPSCAQCTYTETKRVGDITMGDFWGIHLQDPEMFDNKGASLLLVNTDKGDKLWSMIKDSFQVREKNMTEAFQYNHTKPMRLKPERDEFFQRFRDEPINHLLGDFNELKKKKA